MSLLRTSALSTLALCLLAPVVASAAAKPATPADIDAVLGELKKQSQELSKQEKKLNEQREQLDKQQQALAAQRENVEKLQDKLAQITGTPVDVVTPAEKSVSKPVAANTSGATEEVGTDRKPAPREKPPEIAAVIEEGGVLLPKGKLVITPSTEYSRSSATRVAIEGFSIIPALNIGSFEITQIGRDTLTQAVSARLGLTTWIGTRRPGRDATDLFLAPHSMNGPTEPAPPQERTAA